MDGPGQELRLVTLRERVIPDEGYSVPGFALGRVQRLPTIYHKNSSSPTPPCAPLSCSFLCEFDTYSRLRYLFADKALIYVFHTYGCGVRGTFQR